MQNVDVVSDRYVMLDSQKPVTLSAGMGALVAVAAVSGLIVIGTVLCVIQYRRRVRLRGCDDTDEVNHDDVIRRIYNRAKVVLSNPVQLDSYMGFNSSAHIIGHTM